MTYTISALIDSALAEVYGYTQTVEASSPLVTAIDANDLTLTVADGTAFSRGIIEVGDELMMVDSVDQATGTLGISYLSGRGVRGTTAASHAVGDRVVMAPSIPRHAAARAVEEVIRSSGLFAVDSTTLTYSPATVGYTIPASVDAVLSVAWQETSSNQWVPIRRWRLDDHNDLLYVYEGGIPGSSIKVTYAKTPTVPTQAQDFSVTGLPDSCIDVIRYGACWKMSGFLEPSTLMPHGAEADAMKRGNYPTSRIKVSQYYYQLYRARLEDEMRLLGNKNPIRIHYGH